MEDTNLVVKSIERTLGITMNQRRKLGAIGQDKETNQQIDETDNNIITLQIEYKKLTGGFYTPSSKDKSKGGNFR